MNGIRHRQTVLAAHAFNNEVREANLFTKGLCHCRSRCVTTAE